MESYLIHYGVLGMHWGIHKAKRILNSKKSTPEQKKKALESLAQHKIKASEKMNDHDKKADYFQRAIKQRRNLINNLNTRRKKEVYNISDINLSGKISILEAQARDARRQLKKNSKMISIYQSGIRTITRIQETKGKEYLDLLKN